MATFDGGKAMKFSWGKISQSVKSKIIHEMKLPSETGLFVFFSFVFIVRGPMSHLFLGALVNNFKFHNLKCMNIYTV